MQIIYSIFSTIAAIFMGAIAFVLDEIVKELFSTFLPLFDTISTSTSDWLNSYGVSEKMNSFVNWIRPMNKMFYTLAFTVVILIFVWNLFRDLRPGLSRDEGLIAHLYRFLMACFFVGFSYVIIGMFMYMGSAAIEYVYNESSFQLSFEASFGTQMSTHMQAGIADYFSGSNVAGTIAACTIILPVIVMFAIAWNFIKLFLEFAERLVVTTLITSVAPLGFAGLASKETEPITHKYLQMVFSTYLVTLLQVYMLRICVFSMVNMFTETLPDPDAQEPISLMWKIIMTLAILLVAQKVDRIVKESGLSTAQAGTSLFAECMVAGRMLMGGGRRLAHAAGMGGGTAGARFASGKRYTGASAGAAMMKTLTPLDKENVGNSGNFNFDNPSQHFLERDGKGGFYGAASSAQGNTYGFRTTNGNDLQKGESLYTMPSGQKLAVRGDGARDLLSPNNANPNMIGRDQVKSGIEAAAQTRSAGGSVQDAAYAASAAMFRGANAEETEANIQKARQEAQKMLPQGALDGQEVIGAYSLPEDASNVSHVMTMDSETGEMTRHDILSGGEGNTEGFEDREPSSEYRDDNGTLVEDYQTDVPLPQTAEGSSGVTDDFASDLDNESVSGVSGVEADDSYEGSTGIDSIDEADISGTGYEESESVSGVSAVESEDYSNVSGSSVETSESAGVESVESYEGASTSGMDSYEESYGSREGSGEYGYESAGGSVSGEGYTEGYESGSSVSRGYDSYDTASDKAGATSSEKSTGRGSSASESSGIEAVSTKADRTSAVAKASVSKSTASASASTKISAPVNANSIDIRDMNGASLAVPENMSRINSGNYIGCYTSYRDVSAGGKGGKDKFDKNDGKNKKKDAPKRENFMYAPVDRFRPNKSIQNKTRKVTINGKQYYAMKINNADPAGLPFEERTMGYKKK